MKFDYTIHDIYDTYPSLNSGNMKLVGEDVMRYIIAMYSIDSPLRELHPEISERKSVASKIANIEIPEFSGHVFCSAVMEYLRLSGNQKYNEWITIQEAHENLLERARRKIDIKDSQDDKEMRAYALISSCVKDAAELRKIAEELEDELFAQDAELIAEAKKPRITRIEDLVPKG